MVAFIHFCILDQEVRILEVTQALEIGKCKAFVDVFMPNTLSGIGITFATDILLCLYKSDKDSRHVQ